MAGKQKQSCRHRRRSGARPGATPVESRKATPPPPRAPVAPAGPSQQRWLFAVVLALVTLAGFWPVLGHDFTNFDDPRYVTENPHVRQGLGLSGLAWAWSATRAANWHPLTWMSHQMDWQFYGSAPMGHHLTSLLLHLANTLLLFLLFDRLTGKTARSAFVAAAFAVHPLHVESVAWVAERKDVLSTLFWLLTILAYVHWTRARGTRNYLWVVAALACGLAAKPMLVTLPFVLLLLDFWPLGRATVWTLVREKIPLFALAAASSVVTFLVQSFGRTVASVDLYPLGARISNAVVSYVAYLWMTVWPRDLAVYYPHPGGSLELWKVAGAAVVLVALTVSALLLRKSRPYVLVGWLWYLGTLVPVIGLVQVGAQGMADRYSYVPLIGIFVIVAWAVPDLLGAERPTSSPSPWVLAPGVVVVLFMFAGTRAQVATWKNSETLFRHALAVTENNFMAHNNLGTELSRQGRVPEAVEQLEEALRIRPGFAEVHVNLGTARKSQGLLDQARGHFSEAIRLDRRSFEAHYNLGVVSSAQGRTEEAIALYRRAIEIDPDRPRAHSNLANALGRIGKLDEAEAHYRIAIRLRPDYGNAHSNYVGVLLQQGRYAEAWTEVKLARRYGVEPPEPLVSRLRASMPEP
jgi:tetratricopeptide (TPR) repeat protein